MRFCSVLVAALVLSTAFFGGNAVAQTISQAAAGGYFTNSSGTGQSFTATLTGSIDAISVSSQDGGSATLHIYNGNVGSGSVGSVGVPAYSQSIVLNAIPFNNPATFQKINLTTPFPISVGTVYSFVIEVAGTTALFGEFANPYSGGGAFRHFAAPEAAFDLSFQVFEVAAAPPVASPKSIPSTSTWSLIGAAAMIAAAAMLRRRRSSGQSRRQ